MSSPIYPPTTTPLSADTPVTASMIDPLPVPSHSTPGQFTILAKTRINSSSSTPLDALNLVRDTKTWKQWNSFTPSLVFTSSPLSAGEQNGILELGSKFSFDVFLDGKGLVEGAKRSVASPEMVSVLEEIKGEKGGFVGASGEGRKGWRIAWVPNSSMTWLLRAERVLEFVECEDGKGWEFVNWETFGGAMAPLIRYMHGSKLVDRFGDYARDLKEYFEKKDSSS